MYAYYERNEEKNLELIKQRGISFNTIIDAIHEDPTVILEYAIHPNQEKYPHQKVMSILDRASQ